MLEASTPNWGDVLCDIFNDKRFVEVRRNCFQGVIDGVKVGVVLATLSLPYTTFALNKPDFDRLIGSKHAGKVDRAFVVAARGSSSANRVFCSWMEAEELAAKLQEYGVTPRAGRFGEFYTLPPTFFPPDENDWF
jgi:hypothetical protein